MPLEMHLPVLWGKNENRVGLVAFKIDLMLGAELPHSWSWPGCAAILVRSPGLCFLTPQQLHVWRPASPHSCFQSVRDLTGQKTKASCVEQRLQRTHIKASLSVPQIPGPGATDLLRCGKKVLSAKTLLSTSKRARG